MTRAEGPDGGALTVAALPFLRENAYQALLHEQLERRRVRVLTDVRFTPRWAWRAARSVDVVHLHWLEYLVRHRRPGWRSRAAGALRVARLLLTLGILHARRVRLVWTVHNVAPHDRWSPLLDGLLIRGVTRLADCVIVHNNAAAERIGRDLGRRRDVLVVPYGNFIGWYPAETRSRAAVRRELGLGEREFVYLVFGQLRGYKRIPEAIAEFRTLVADDVRMVVAGNPTPEVRDAIVRAAGNDERVLLRFGFVPDEQVAHYHAAADAAVVPYGETFTSSALLLALSFGLPAVVPGAGASIEVAAPPAVEPFDSGGLAAALERIRRGDQHVRRGAARAAAERASWEHMADQLMTAYGARRGGGVTRAPRRARRRRAAHGSSAGSPPR